MIRLQAKDVLIVGPGFAVWNLVGRIHVPQFPHGGSLHLTSNGIAQGLTQPRRALAFVEATTMGVSREKISNLVSTEYEASCLSRSVSPVTEFGISKEKGSAEV